MQVKIDGGFHVTKVKLQCLKSNRKCKNVVGSFYHSLLKIDIVPIMVNQWSYLDNLSGLVWRLLTSQVDCLTIFEQFRLFFWQLDSLQGLFFRRHHRSDHVIYVGYVPSKTRVTNFPETSKNSGLFLSGRTEVSEVLSGSNQKTCSN